MKTIGLHSTAGDMFFNNEFEAEYDPSEGPHVPAVYPAE